MGVILEAVRKFFHIQQTDTDKIKPTLVANFDKLSQAMNEWSSPSDKDEIEKQLRILSEPYPDNIPKIAYGKILAFSQLAKLAGEKHRYDFQVEIVGENNNRVKLSVKNIFSKSFAIFSDPIIELHNALKIPLMNGSQYLDIESDIEQLQLVNFIKRNVRLTINNEQERGFNIAGVTEGNQERLGIGDFSLDIREKLESDSQLLQTFIMTKMKCFDYFGDIIKPLTEFQMQSFAASKQEQEIAIELKLHFNTIRNEIEKFLSNQLENNSNIFSEYYNKIMGTNCFYL